MTPKQETDELWERIVGRENEVAKLKARPYPATSIISWLEGANAKDHERIAEIERESVA